MPWNFADTLDQVATAVPLQDPAILYDGVPTSWADFIKRTNALARALVNFGCLEGDKIALLMRNHPAYLEAAFAGFKARLVHVNVNFRYNGDELHYLFDNSDSAVIFYQSEFAHEIAALAHRLPKVKLFVELGDSAPKNDFAVSYESLTQGDATPLNFARSPDDLLFIYTGGTTGLPKGVMWPQGVLWKALGGGSPMPGMVPPPTSIDALLEQIRSGVGRNRLFVAPPLMHGTGFMMALSVLGRGGSVVLSSAPSFNPLDVWQQIAQHHCEQTVIVGDAFAKPMLDALEANPNAYDLSHLKLIVSSGTIWSPQVKQGFLEHMPGVLLMDTLGASEGVGIGLSFSSKHNIEELGRFRKDERTLVLDDNDQPLAPGSPHIGRIARAGALPLGYYKDPEKTAHTYPVIQGTRYCIAGDYGMIDADGSIRLIGRGSHCINTGGEKVFPEEVEEALKQHPAVKDALVVGIPHEKWGSAVTALVQCCGDVDAAGLRAHVKTLLSSYKAPKFILFVEEIARGPNGKPDYRHAKIYAEMVIVRDDYL
jgi:3-oxocholest-4-en-26-oate---CoA ligase